MSKRRKRPDRPDRIPVEITGSSPPISWIWRLRACTSPSSRKRGRSCGSKPKRPKETANGYGRSGRYIERERPGGTRLLLDRPPRGRGAVLYVLRPGLP